MTIVTPFFGVIVFGGLSVLGSLFLAAAIGVSETWRIRAGRVEIDQQVLATRHSFVLEPRLADCVIVEVPSMESGPSYHIRIDAKPPVFPVQKGLFQQFGQWILAHGHSRQQTGLQSPGFSSERAAQDALVLLCGDYNEAAAT